MQIILYLTITIPLLIGLEVHSENLEPIVKHIKIGETHYVDSGRSHYGFTREDNGIFKTVSVNNDKVTVWLPDCTTIIRTWSQLNRVDRKAMREAQRVINTSYRDFKSMVADDQNKNYIEIYKSGNKPNPKQTLNTVNHHGAILYQHSPSDVVEYSDLEVSLSGEKLANIDDDLRRAFVNKKSIAYIYKDRFVIMKPRWCQFVDDQALLLDLGMKF